MANLLIDLDLIFILLQIFPTRFFEDSGIPHGSVLEPILFISTLLLLPEKSDTNTPKYLPCQQRGLKELKTSCRPYFFINKIFDG
jgi:hypothetical protein